MSALIKALVGIGVLGSASVVAAGAYYVSLPKTIGDKLFQEGLTLLDITEGGTSDLEAWQQRVTEHSKTNPTPQKTKIAGLDLSATGDQASSQNISAFKKKCRDLILLSLTDADVSTREQEVRDWCLKNESN